MPLILADISFDRRYNESCRGPRCRVAERGRPGVVVEHPDRGDVPGWVIVTAITVTLAIAIGVIIVQKITDKANNINLQ